MAYTLELNGYARKDLRIANAITFCDGLGGEEYDAVRRFLDCTGVVPAWLALEIGRAKGGATCADADGTWHKYVVTHKGVDRATVARSEAQAVNFVRFKLYGTRPLESLPPFSARQVAETAHERTMKACVRKANAPLTRADVAARLRRMAK